MAQFEGCTVERRDLSESLSSIPDGENIHAGSLRLMINWVRRSRPTAGDERRTERSTAFLFLHSLLRGFRQYFPTAAFLDLRALIELTGMIGLFVVQLLIAVQTPLCERTGGDGLQDR